MGPVWEATRAYLEDETVEVLPPELVRSLVVEIKAQGLERDPSALEKQISDLIAKSRVMDPEDARTTAAGVLKRAGSVLRLERAAALHASLHDLLSPALEKGMINTIPKIQ